MQKILQKFQSTGFTSDTEIVSYIYEKTTVLYPLNALSSKQLLPQEGGGQLLEKSS